MRAYSIPNGNPSFEGEHHYHSTAHEALPCGAGSARVMLGGPDGREVEAIAGELLVLPAESGRWLAWANAAFRLLGAYPTGQEWGYVPRGRRRGDAAPDRRGAGAAFRPLGGREGRIPIDGQDIRDLTRASLRRQIGMVQHDVFLFGGTMRENIAYGRLDATEDEILEAAHRARLRQLIVTLPRASTRSWASAASPSRAGKSSSWRSRGPSSRICRS